MRDTTRGKLTHRMAALNRLMGLGVGIAVAGAVVKSTLYNVDGGERAVIFDRFRGVLPHVVGEGTHFLIPWVQRPVIFSVRSKPRRIPVITGSKDLQNVDITLRILFRPEEKALPWIFTHVGVDFDEKILPSITNEVLKGVVAMFDASELITQREVVSQRVNELLQERAESFHLLLDDISITHLSFGREFTEAVEMKQVAQQDAERARFLVEKAEQMKQAAIISSSGDSQAAELLSKAFQEAGDGLIELRRLEAAEEIATSLSKSRNVAYLPGGGGAGGPNLLLSIPP